MAIRRTDFFSNCFGENMTTELRGENTAAHNITYTQAGVSCFVGQESGKFKV